MFSEMKARSNGPVEKAAAVDSLLLASVRPVIPFHGPKTARLVQTGDSSPKPKRRVGAEPFRHTYYVLLVLGALVFAKGHVCSLLGSSLLHKVAQQLPMWIWQSNCELSSRTIEIRLRISPNAVFVNLLVVYCRFVGCSTHFQ